MSRTPTSLLSLHRAVLPSMLFELLWSFPSAHSTESVSNIGSSCIVKARSGSYGYNPIDGRGPTAWGDIPGYETCSKGKRQSPIDFPISSDAVSFQSLYRHGPKPNMTLLSSSMFTFSPGTENWALSCASPRSCGSTYFNGTTFFVANIHFHTPAEHTLNGQQFPLEAHIVHVNHAQTQLLVIATLFEYPRDDDYGAIVHRMANKEYGAHPLFKQIIDAVVSDKPVFAVKIGRFLRFNEGGVCAYNGGLTTPPCTEVVTFLMQNKRQIVSKEQVHTYLLTCGGGMYGNNRPLQPLNARKLTCYLWVFLLE